jgi:DNA-binding FrmR family transcriptional regulator
LDVVGKDLDSIHGINQDVDNILDSAVETLKDIDALSKGTAFLLPVPFVDGIAGEISNIVNPFSNPLGDMVKVLTDIKKGIDDIDKVVKASDKVTDKVIVVDDSVELFLPKAAKTVTVLGYVIQIINCILPILAETSLSEKVAELQKKINTIDDNVDKAVTKVDTTINKLQKDLQKAEDECKKISTSINSIKGFTDKFSKVTNAIKPVSDAVDKVINTITPIKWVLKASDCLIKKVLKPAVDKIMEVTGLNKLVEPLKDKIESLLDIANMQTVLDSAGKAVADSVLRDVIKVLEKYPGVIKEVTDELNSAFGMFSPTSNDDLKKGLQECVAGLFDATVDPDAPAVIPDWPDDIDVYDDTSLVLQKRVRVKKIDWYSLYRKYDKVMLAKNRTKFSRVELMADEYPICTEIADKANSIVTAWESLNEAVLLLNKQVGILSETTNLPDSFNAEVRSFSMYLTFNAEILDTVTKLSLAQKWEDLLEQVSAWLKSQSGDCADILTEIASIKTSVVGYQDNVNGIVALISSEDIEKLQIAVNSYSQSLHLLLSGFDLADDHHPGNDDKDKLEAQRKKVLDNAQALLTDLGTLEDKITETTALYGKANDGLENVLSTYQKISPEGYILPDSMVNQLVKVSSILSQLQGVFEPLDAIIEALKDKSEIATVSGSFNPLAFAQRLLLRLDGSISTQVDNLDIKTLLYELTPISILKSDLYEFETKDLVADKGLLDSLSKQTAEITELINKGCTYTIDNEEVTNKFLDEDGVVSLIELSNKITQH